MGQRIWRNSGKVLSRPVAFFLFALGAVALVTLTVLLTADLAARLIVSVVVLMAIFFTSSAIRPEHVSRASVHLAAIGVAAAALGGYSLFSNEMILAGIATIVSAAGYPGLVQSGPSYVSELMLFLVLMTCFSIIYVTRYRPAMGFYPPDLDAAWSEKDAEKGIGNLVGQLRHDLDVMDKHSDWRAGEYISLDAEVEIFHGNRRVTKVTDLQKALRKHTENTLFVVLGDPGAGKSVALRKLARDLLEEVPRSGRIPVYINLKEWRPNSPWTPQNQPTTEDLAKFILSALRGRLGLNTSAFRFFNANFENLLGSGRLFLIFDSFDEIPQILDSQDASWLISCLSNVCVQLITDSPQGRGIIGSRLFRQPKVSSDKFIRLDIRPFSDAMIERLIHQQAGSKIEATVIKEALFARRPDLATLGRNPLLLTLLVEYVNRHNGLLPNGQYDLFRDHMDYNIQIGLQSSDYNNLDADTIWSVTGKIARTMFEEATYGLEMPLEQLRTRLANLPVESVMFFLNHAKLGQFGEQGRVFSFVHRRFNEFFLAQWLLEDQARIFLRAKAIPEDGQWRDAIALYGEVAPESEARWLVEYCLEGAQPLLSFQCEPGDPQYSRGLHCLRFLADSFRGRPSYLAPAQEAISKFILSALGEATNDILIRKNAVESVGLLPLQTADHIITIALSHGDAWARETAFRACRYMPSLTTIALSRLSNYFQFVSFGTLVVRYNEYRMIFSLSEPFSVLKKSLPLRLIEGVVALILMLALLASKPTLLATLLAFYIFGGLVIGVENFRSSGQRTDEKPWILKCFDLMGGDGCYFSVFTAKAMMLYIFSTNILLPFLLSIPVVLVGAISFVVYSDFDRIWDALFPGKNVGYHDFFRGAGIGSPYDDEIRLSLYALVILSMPWSLLYATIKLRASQPLSLDKILPRKRLLVYMAGFCLLMFLAILIPGYLMSLLPTHIAKYAAYALCAVAALPIGRQVLRVACRRIQDQLSLRRMRRHLPTSRTQIVQELDQLRTSAGRLLYVNFLFSRITELDHHMRHPDNRWPTAGRPNYYNDDASALLARLDERWLGLSR